MRGSANKSAGDYRKKNDIPKEFIKKIRKLGMKEEDADILYRTKIDWTAVYSNNKIYCTETGCDYYTKLDNDDLKNHMISDHNYGKYPCTRAHCNFVAYSKSSLNRHSAMHTRRFEKQFWYKCTRPGCKSSFQFEYDLAIHLRIHDNDVHVCRYCPYLYVKPLQYKRHLKMHFRIKDCECDQCDLKFATITELNRHYQKHEGLIYNCLICKTYEAVSKHNMETHLRRVHKDIFGKNVNWEAVEHHVEIK